MPKKNIAEVEEKEYLIPLEWVVNAHIPVRAKTLQEAINAVGMMGSDKAKQYAVTSGGFQIREELIDELNPNVPQSELDSLDLDSGLIVSKDDDDDDSRDVHGDRNPERDPDKD